MNSPSSQITSHLNKVPIKTQSLSLLIGFGSDRQPEFRCLFWLQQEEVTVLRAVGKLGYKNSYHYLFLKRWHCLFKFVSQFLIFTSRFSVPSSFLFLCKNRNIFILLIQKKLIKSKGINLSRALGGWLYIFKVLNLITNCCILWDHSMDISS